MLAKLRQRAGETTSRADQAPDDNPATR